jgi:hypothetical protein
MVHHIFLAPKILLAQHLVAGASIDHLGREKVIKMLLGFLEGMAKLDTVGSSAIDRLHDDRKLFLSQEVFDLIEA